MATEELARHMQVIWTPLSASPDSPEMGVHGLDRWHVTGLAAKRALLLAGIGWGSMPVHLVDDDIETGRLCSLDLQSWKGDDRMPRYAIAIVRLKKGVHGPGARLLSDALRRIGQVTEGR
jgi:DNA-binding transcriptional LysR family regulator